jgi:hypothetical protein
MTSAHGGAVGNSLTGHAAFGQILLPSSSGDILLFKISIVGFFNLMFGITEPSKLGRG